MKAVTFAAGAALVGSAVAGSHVQKMHQKLHRRSDWNDWSSSDPVVDATTSDWPTPVIDSTTSTDWPTPVVDSTTAKGDWPTSSADWTTSKSADATSTTIMSNYWGDWESTTTSKKADPTSSSDWADWSSTTSKKADPTSSMSNYWGDWESTTTSKKADPTTSAEWADWSSTTSKKSDPTTSAEWSDWESTTVDPTTTIWADWSSETDPAATTQTWADWSEGSVVVTTIHTTTTKTIWLGNVKSTETASASSWADWSSASSATPVVATSTVGWSSSGWVGASWPVDATQACVQQIITSYGAPTWTPTATVTVTVTPSASSWADWESTSSKPVVASSSSSAGWADWSSTSSKPVVATTSTSASWADWESTTSSKPVVATTSTAASWNEWSSSAAASTTASWGAGFYQASASSSASWSAPTGSSGSGSLTSNGNYFGMTYSPYTSGGQCKDAWTVESDIAIIAKKGFTTVRVYSTDCSTLENVGKAVRDNNMKIILGVFISATGISGAQEQVTDIVAWKQWDIVELIVVGNEAVFNGYCSASDLAGFISSSTWAFKAAGYTGKVTTTEPLTIWENQGTAFCGVVDVVAANLYAFFNAQTTADKAGDLIQAQIGILNGVCSGKETYVMESGWPSAGECNGLACPSKENQATALKGIQAVSGSKIVFFSYEDEAWKAPGEFNVEQHWGCADIF